jgi:RNase adaptor protein for sRNA GlmZ degradation
MAFMGRGTPEPPPDEPGGEPLPKVAVVGPSAAGKSTLITALRAAGYNARHVAQEHSYVPDMWLRISKPDVLIYLDVSYEASRRRRPLVGWQPDRREVEVHRLRHARAHADLIIHTDDLSPAEIQRQVFVFLQEWRGNHGRQAHR